MCEHLVCCRCRESCPRHVAPRRTPQGPSAPCPLETPHRRGASHWGRVAPGAPGTGPADAGSRPAGRIAAAHTGCFRPRPLENCSARMGGANPRPPRSLSAQHLTFLRQACVLKKPISVAVIPIARMWAPRARPALGRRGCGSSDRGRHGGPHTPWPPDPTTSLPLFSISPFSSRENSLFQAISHSWVPFISISCFWSLVELYFSDVNCSEHTGQCWFLERNSVIPHLHRALRVTHQSPL